MEMNGKGKGRIETKKDRKRWAKAALKRELNDGI